MGRIINREKYLDPITFKEFEVVIVQDDEGSKGALVPLWVKSKPENWL